MKIRKGFVSNSSSSSFTCGVCGAEACGWDVCLSDWGMITCEQGHVMCQDHLEYEEEIEELLDSYGDEVRIDSCPICNLNHISNTNVLRFLLKREGLVKSEVEADIKNRFKTLIDLLVYLNS